ncbi:MAG: guanylate kinase [Ignavibacteriales bacterium]|nr:guanylate kinase [Ignavibacteriales bacterium]
MHRSKLFVFSAPSGSGKTTIARAILQRHPEFVFSISATTRKKRPNEIDGKDYFFLSQESFKKKITENEFIENEEIYGDYYGSLKKQVDEALHHGQNMVFDIDVKGALAIKKTYPENAVLIFVVPPTVEILRERLQKRNTEEHEKLQRRLARVPMEMEKQKEFDHIVFNDDLQRAITETEFIIKKYLNH